MATISETATLEPRLQMFSVPMRPDNTPVAQGDPIGIVRWPGSAVLATLLSTNVVELAVSLTIPQNYALKFISWGFTMGGIDSAMDGYINAWADQADVTFQDEFNVQHIVFRKPGTTLDTTITNAQAFAAWSPVVGQNYDRAAVPESPPIFRAVMAASGTARPAITFTSMVSALLFTVEQFSQGHIHSAQPVLTSPGGAAA